MPPVDEFHPLQEIIGPRDHGEEHRQPAHEQKSLVEVLSRTADFQQEGEKNGNELERRVDFTDERRFDLEINGHERQYQDPTQDDAVAADDDYGQPSRDHTDNGQRREHADHESLVGKGVEVGPYDGRLVENPGEKPVKTVGDPGNDETNQGLAVFTLDQENHNDRDEDDPENGKEIRDIH